MYINKLAFLFPFVAASAWLAALIGLIVYWVGPDGHKTYGRTQPWVVYISDVGGIHKGLFIATCAIVFVSFPFCLISEYILRKRFMIPNCRYDSSALNSQFASIVFGTIGVLFLLLLSCVNLYINGSVHWSFTIVFVVGVGISAILNVVENYRIWEETRLKFIHILAVTKLILLVLAIIDLIIFIATYAEKGRGSCVLLEGERRMKGGECGHVASTSGATEWALGFIWFLFVTTYLVDFLPGVMDVRPQEWREPNYAPGDAYNLGKETQGGDYAPTEEPSAYPGQEGMAYNPSYPDPKQPPVYTVS